MYFMPYIQENQKHINFIFLLVIYKINTLNSNDILYYKSLSDLSKLCKIHCNYTISSSTLSRILTDKRYSPYFIHDTNNKTIQLIHKKDNQFVILTNANINILLQYQDNFMIQYYLYLKYYCGYSKSNTTDSTGEQILLAMGYSANSGQSKNNLCIFNQILEKEGLIFIKRMHDHRGYNRNVYSINPVKFEYSMLINEPTIAGYLEYLNIPFAKEYRFCDLQQYRFDFFCNNSYIIEYDGKQHFTTIDKNLKKDYLKTHANDLIKNKYCFERNIPIIRIPYDAEYTLEDLQLKTTRFLLTPENEFEYYNSRKNKEK